MADTDLVIFQEAALEELRSGQGIAVPRPRRSLKSAGRLAARAGESPGLVYVHNPTGQAWSRFGVVGLDEPRIDPTVGEESTRGFLRAVTFSGAVPTDDHASRTAVLLAECKAGATVPAVATGRDVAVEIVVGEGHSKATTAGFDPDAADVQRLQAGVGHEAQIVWPRPGDLPVVGTGEDPEVIAAVVRLGFPSLQIVVAKVTSAQSDVGYYDAQFVQVFRASGTVDGDLALADIDFTDAETGTLMHLPDIGESSHGLSVDDVLGAVRAGQTDAGDPMLVSLGGGGGGDSLPTPTDQYQVIITLDGETWTADYPRFP